MLRAPNRGPTGLLLPDVQAFTWQSSEGRSILAAGNFRLRRRPVAGLGFGATYTLARSRDNTTATGGERDGGAGRSRISTPSGRVSSFDRRHQFSADANIELPFGPNRPWLNGGGVWAALLEDWSVNTDVHLEVGRAAHAARLRRRRRRRARHERHAARELHRRADRGRRPDDRAVLQHGRVHQCRCPATFGDALRNMIVGPGNRQLNASFSRDIRMGRNRTLGLQLTASNLLNMVQWAGVDTNVNSLTFGQVTSVRPMRSMQLNIRVRF